MRNYWSAIALPMSYAGFGIFITVEDLPAEQPTVETSRDGVSVGDRGQSEKLRPLNSVVGSWRGVGQPKRGSRAGAWQEQIVCRWDFSGAKPVVRFDAENGRQFQSLVFALPDDAALILTQLSEGTTAITYSGAIPDKWPGKIQLISAPDADGVVFRCTIEQLSDIRLVLLFERRTSPNGNFRRIAGIGYTRSGHRLASSSGNQRECVVTGGHGSIPVIHEGKTWYVCCEGCRQAFEESPEEIIAEYLSQRSKSKK